MSKRDKPGLLIPKAAGERISLYLRCLEALRDRGESTTSSQHLGEALGITAAQVRKDLGYFGQFGFPGVGYKISKLIPQLRQILGTDKTWRVALVGLGNLGTALAWYKGFERQGFSISALFDTNPALYGKYILARPIQPIEELPGVVRAQDIRLGIIAVPAAVAQDVADRLVQAGIRGIFNFAPAVLSVPEGVAYVSIDLAVQLEQLTFSVAQLARGRGRARGAQEVAPRDSRGPRGAEPAS